MSEFDVNLLQSKKYLNRFAEAPTGHFINGKAAPLVAAIMVITPDNGWALEIDWGIEKCHAE